MAADMMMNPIGHIMEIFDEQQETTEKFSTWIDNGGSYSPAVNIVTKPKLPAGVYKISIERDEYKIVPIDLNTDQLYVFSENFIKDVLDEVEKFWSMADVYKKHNLVHKRGLLLEGGCGGGKTSLISLLIKQIVDKNGIVFLARNAQEFNCMVDAMKITVREIEPDRPIISVIEDIDKIIDIMGGNGDLLSYMDGALSIDHHLIILTSNDTSNLSDAVLRPSRIDMRYEIPNPSKKIRKEYFIKKGLSEELAEDYANKTNNMSFADLKELFVGTQILGKNAELILSQLKNPKSNKDYLNVNKRVRV